ncbi:MAG TPA: hypothetical protein VF704_12835 [Allosphingosinicella sp.]|jgi:hypothetical protein
MKLLRMIRDSPPPLLIAIEAYMRRTKTSPSRFGRSAVGDPNFVTALRDGRSPRAVTIRRVFAFIASNGGSA